MSKIEFLKEQMIEARAFVKRLMSELPEDLWYVIPEGCTRKKEVFASLFCWFTAD